MKKILLLILLLLSLSGCSKKDIDKIENLVNTIEEIKEVVKDSQQTSDDPKRYVNGVNLEDVEFNGSSYAVVNGGIPFFDELTIEEFEEYSDLDYLGRPQIAFANISPETLPTEERGSIANVKPVGWHTYNTKELWNQVLPDNTFYVYNRCHLIAFSLAGENANELNLITGTRYLNMNMTDFEEEVRNYVQKTGNHVMYRVTPIYKEDELVARGVLMEAKSVETNDVEFCVYLFNVQMLEDGTMLNIDYKTGEVVE